MKIKREQLKAIVKECLVELLQDGLGGTLFSEHSGPRDRSLEPLPGQNKRAVSMSSVDPAAVRRRTMDLTEHGGNRPQPSSVIHEAQRQRKQAMSQLVANAAPNALMASIFADTAQTTFASQESSGAGVAGDTATKAVAASDPMNMFGEDKIDAWNRAAFAPTRPGILNSPLANNLLKDK